MESILRLLGMSYARVAVFGTDKWHAYDDELNGAACGALAIELKGEHLLNDARTVVLDRPAGERCRRAACARSWPPPLRAVS